MNRISAEDRIGRWLLAIVFGVFPIFFLPTTQDFYDTNKWLLLIGASLIVLLLWVVRVIRMREATLSHSSLFVAVCALLIASAASTIGSQGSRLEAVVSPSGVLFYASLVILIGLGASFFDRESRAMLRFGITLGASAAGLIAAYQAFGIGRYLTSAFPALSDPLWTPVGSSTGLLVLLLIVAPHIVSDVVRHYRKNADTKLIGSGILLLLVATGVFVTLYRLIPQLSQIILPIKWAWAITLEAFKDPRAALFGIGTQNYLSAFTGGRPVAFNTTPLWNVRFTTGSTYFLHLITTLGLFGILSSILFLRSLWNKNDTASQRVSVLIAILALLLVPPSLAAIVAIVGLRIAHMEEPRSVTIRLSHIPWAPAVIATVSVSIVLAATLFIGRAYAAELAFYQSLLAAQRNNGTETYNLQRRTLELNPDVTRYHVAYSQTNLAIANALAISLAAEATQSAQPTDIINNNRQLIATLVQQAIREGKAAVNLSPTSVLAWENLARIYQSLTPIAQGADAWAVASYQQAIALDPTNPVLRLDLGGMYIRQENYDSAIQQFIIATQLKLDLANAHYNLANAYRLTGNYDKAAAELEATRVLIDQGSEDHAKVIQELEDLDKRKTAEPLPSGETLTTPQEPSPIIEPRLTLPESAQPEATGAGSE